MTEKEDKDEVKGLRWRLWMRRDEGRNRGGGSGGEEKVELEEGK